MIQREELYLLIDQTLSIGSSMKVILCAFFAASVVTTSLAYPTGAPDFACDTMVPLHGVGPQSGDGSYNVSVNGGSSYMPGKLNDGIQWEEPRSSSLLTPLIPVF